MNFVKLGGLLALLSLFLIAIAMPGNAWLGTTATGAMTAGFVNNVMPYGAVSPAFAETTYYSGAEGISSVSNSFFNGFGGFWGDGCGPCGLDSPFLAGCSPSGGNVYGQNYGEDIVAHSVAFGLPPMYGIIFGSPYSGLGCVC
jgi:hypothetical protein